jgi:hypothetical protein
VQVSRSDSTDPAEFAWVRTSLIGDAGCLTLVESGDPAAVASAFGGDLDPGQPPAGLDRLIHSTVDAPAVALRRLDNWVLVVEYNGWQGSRPEVLRAAATAGRAVSAYWSVNADTRFSYALDGLVLTTFEANSPGQRHGEDPDRLEAYRAGLDWGSGDPAALMLALMARVTGTIPVPQWLAGDFAIVAVLPPAEDVATKAHPEMYQLTYDDPLLSFHLCRASAAQLRAVAALAVERAVAATGLATEPAVAAVLASRPPATSPALEDMFRRTLAAIPRAGKTRQPLLRSRYYTLDAIRESTGPDPLAAAFGALAAADTCLVVLGSPRAPLRQAVLDILGDPPVPTGSLGLPAVDDARSPTGRYRWITRHWLSTAGSIALAHTTDVEGVAGMLGDPARSTTAIPFLSDEPMAALRRDGDWTTVIAGPVGGTGLYAATRLSTVAGTVLLVAWRARGRVQFWYLSGGRLLAHLDPQRPEQRAGEQPDVLDPYLTDLPMPIPGATSTEHVPTVLALIHRLTAVELAPAALDEPHLLLPLGQ